MKLAVPRKCMQCGKTFSVGIQISSYLNGFKDCNQHINFEEWESCATDVKTVTLPYIKSKTPNTYTPTSYEQKLDKIIELLQKLLDK